MTNEREIERIVGVAAQSLPRMQLPNGRFCYEVVRGDPNPHGESIRYSAIVAIGLLKAEAYGYRHDVDVAALERALRNAVDDPEITSGDLGLYLWADARRPDPLGQDLVDRLDRRLLASGGVAALEGLELGWIVTGLALHVARSESTLAHKLLETAIDQLLANQARSGLFFHYGTSRIRRRFPNFATQAYGILALATVAKQGLDRRALGAARRAADRIVTLQLPDGGWPWLFDAERGRIVEPYEVYSVHQDSMAPMALLELAEASGESAYADAALAGLDWIDGQNELSLDFVDAAEGLIYRSIRHRRGWDRALLYGTTLVDRVFGRVPDLRGRWIELNPTDRPYHLGWILEAWCGREAAGFAQRGRKDAHDVVHA